MQPAGYRRSRLNESLLKGRVDPGDIVLIFTGYRPPQTDTDLPEVKALTNEAADLLVGLPVRAFGTDAFSVDSLGDMTTPPVHQPFLSRSIPVYERLFNLDKLLGEGSMFFVGAPLNVKEGDGMLVRPIVFVY